MFEEKATKANSGTEKERSLDRLVARLARKLQLGSGWHVVFYASETERDALLGRVHDLGIHSTDILIPVPFNQDVGDLLLRTASLDSEIKALFILGEFHRFQDDKEVHQWFTSMNQLQSEHDRRLKRIVWWLPEEYRGHFDCCPDWNSRCTSVLTVGAASI